MNWLTQNQLEIALISVEVVARPSIGALGGENRGSRKFPWALTERVRGRLIIKVWGGESETTLNKTIQNRFFKED
ncbi:MAG: hypothetical protein Aurels2KO_14570 [Aureliella sp.]